VIAAGYRDAAGRNQDDPTETHGALPCESESQASVQQSWRNVPSLVFGTDSAHPQSLPPGSGVSDTPVRTRCYAAKDNMGGKVISLQRGGDAY
jgi:hypothetical protein